MQRGAKRAALSLGCAPGTLSFEAVPLADGGEGTLDALLRGAGGTKLTAEVCDPLGRKVQAAWGVLGDSSALIEMAQASGLTLVSESERDALNASSTGTGQLIKAALDRGCKEILIGIGGSATTDGGSGALAALGAKFLDANGEVLPPGGAALNELHTIELSQIDSRLRSTRITVLCDVTNPLFGENGAAYVYGPQKGATPDEVKVLDAGLRRLAEVTAATLGRDLSTQPGAGAAGGMGFGLMAFANAELKPGIEVVLEATRFEEKLQSANLVLTGEGALDAQTLSGKAIAGVCKAAKQADVPVIAFGGKVALRGEELSTLGLLSAFPIADAPMSLEDCIARADELLTAAVERVLRLWLAARI
jgi:glycerate kinase